MKLGAGCQSGSQGYIILAKMTAARNEDALNYHKLRGLYFMAVIFVATIVSFATLITIHLLVELAHYPYYNIP